MQKLLALVALIYLSCTIGNISAQKYEGPQEDIDAILSNIKSFSQFYVNGEVNKLVECYTNDGKIMPGGADIMQGKEALTNYWTLPPHVKTLYHKATPLELIVTGDRATDFGYYEGSTQVHDRIPSKWKGKYVILWRKVEGQWKIEVDIWNAINNDLNPPVVKEFQMLLDSIYDANKESIGMMIHVEAPDQGISWSSAVGLANKNMNRPIDKNQPALIASNTKTFVAAAILKLIEHEKLTLDLSIEKLLRMETRTLFEAADYSLDQVTIKHLLSHTSGIQDYVNKEYFDFVNSNPHHKWTMEEQIKRSASLVKPNTSPGEKYEYADINFVLLCEILEQVTEKPFYIAIRNLIDYQKLGLRNTWFINLEDAPLYSKPLVHQYNDKYNWDSYDLNPSWDLHGGGGLASTTNDLAIFFHHLFNGLIVEDNDLLELMHTFVLPKKESIYCLGLMKLDFDGQEAYYHGGYWGTNVIHLPEMNTSIASFTLKREARDLNAELSKKILQLIKEE